MKTMVFSKLRQVEVPVLRNGKETKRTKKVWREFPISVEMIPISIEGHVVYYRKDQFENPRYSFLSLYREDGSLLTCICKYGRTGQACHIESYQLNKETMKPVVLSNGYNGSTGKGWGATLIQINWN